MALIVFAAVALLVAGIWFVALLEQVAPRT
jgi:hypothetical protein